MSSASTLLQFLVDKGYLKHNEKNLYTTFLASSFRTLRFGLLEAHGKGMAVQFNYLTDKGAFVYRNGTWDVDETKIKGAVRDLAHDLLMLEATGDYAGTKQLFDKLAILRPERCRHHSAQTNGESAGRYPPGIRNRGRYRARRKSSIPELPRQGRELKIVVGITGATGSIIGVRLLEAMKEAGLETHLIVSKWGSRTMTHETSRTLEDVSALASHSYNPNDQGAAISSGSVSDGFSAW